MPKKRTIRQRPEDATVEVDLAPMLSMMVTLIPILLLSVMFIRVAIIETPVPQVVAKAIKKDEKNKKPKLRLDLQISSKSGFKLTVIERGRKKTVRVKNKKNELDFEGLHTALIPLKQKYPEVFKITINPNEDVTYQQIVSSMDAVRKMKSGDPEVFVKDEASKSQVKTSYLFPNVSFGNIVQ